MVKNSAGISVAYQINDCCSLYPINDCIIPQESRISPLEEDPQAAPEVGGDLENLFFSFFSSGTVESEVRMICRRQ